MAREDLIPDQTGAIRIEPLGPSHDVSTFDCGVEPLNVFLQRHARTAPQQGLSQTWVVLDDDDKVLGYYTLAIATTTKAAASARVAKGMPNYDNPVVLLARLAIDLAVRGQGLGGVVLQAAMDRACRLGRQPTTADGSPGLPLRAMLVHAIDETAAGFYRHHGFEPSPTDASHLFLLLKDIETARL